MRCSVPSAGPGPASSVAGAPDSSTTASSSGASCAAASDRRSPGSMPRRTAGGTGRPAAARSASRASLRRGRGRGSERDRDRARSRRRQATFGWCGEREDLPSRPDLPPGRLLDGTLGLQQLGVLRPARASPAASRRAWRPAAERTCENCGVAFETANEKRRYCSDRCRMAAFARRKRAAGEGGGKRMTTDWLETTSAVSLTRDQVAAAGLPAWSTPANAEAAAFSFDGRRFLRHALRGDPHPVVVAAAPEDGWHHRAGCRCPLCSRPAAGARLVVTSDPSSLHEPATAWVPVDDLLARLAPARGQALPLSGRRARVRRAGALR